MTRQAINKTMIFIADILKSKVIGFRFRVQGSKVVAC